MNMVMSPMMVVICVGIVCSYSRKKRYGDAPAHLNLRKVKEVTSANCAILEDSQFVAGCELY